MKADLLLVLCLLFSAPSILAAQDTPPLTISVQTDASECPEGTTGRARVYPNGGAQSLGSGHFYLPPETVDSRSNQASFSSTADFNGDGAVDLVFESAFGPDIFFNNGDGSFRNSLEVFQLDFTTARSDRGIPGDVDGDGDVDLYTPGQAKIWINDGSGNFQARPDFVPAPRTTVGVNDAVFGDFDQDGVQELVAVNLFQVNKLILYENDGTGAFTIEDQYLTSLIPYQIVSADFNLDGWEDVAIASGSFAAPSEFEVYLNDQDGTFTQTGITYNVSGRTSDLNTGDVNNDGYDDLVFTNRDGPHEVWLNNQDNTFSMVVQTFGERGAAADLADLNGDGNLDVVVGATFLVALPNRITTSIYYGAGDGTFTLEEELANLPGDNIGHIGHTTTIADFDADGDLDVFTGTQIAFNDDRYVSPYQILWSNGATTEEITGLAPGSYGVTVTDATGLSVTQTVEVLSQAPLEIMADVTDLRCSGNQPGEISITGVVGGSLRILKRVEEVYASPGAGQSFVAVGDVDGDGDLDVLNTTHNSENANNPNLREVIWLNDGDGTFTEGQEFIGRSGYNGKFGDMDGDGDLDILIMGYREIYAHFNDGTGNFITGTETYNFSIGGIVGQVWNTPDLTDLDGDGDLDAFIFSNNYQVQFVLLNDGDGTFTQSSEVYGLTMHLGASIGDLDGDGDADVFLPAFGSNSLVLKNDGDGTFTYPDVSYGSSYEHTRSTLADLDGDGDLDAITLAAETQEGQTVKVLMNDGTGVFTELPEAFTRLGDRPLSVATLDFDGDGDLDVFLGKAGVADNQSKLYLNDGNARFTELPPNYTSPVSFGVNDATFADLDGDGDLDLVLGTTAGFETLRNEPNCYTYQWGPEAENQTTPTITNLSPGSYSVTVSDFNNCQETTTFILEAPVIDCNGFPWDGGN